MAIPQDIRNLHDREREMALLSIRFEVRERMLAFARIYQELHPELTAEDCQEAANNALADALAFSFEPKQHPYWQKLLDESAIIVQRAFMESMP